MRRGEEGEETYNNYIFIFGYQKSRRTDDTVTVEHVCSYDKFRGICLIDDIEGACELRMRKREREREREEKKRSGRLLQLQLNRVDSSPYTPSVHL